MSGKSSNQIEIDELIEPGQAASIIGVSVARLRELAFQDRVPVAMTLPSGRRLFRQCDVERYAADRRRARRVA